MLPSGVKGALTEADVQIMRSWARPAARRAPVATASFAGDAGDATDLV